ncbi:FHA domain-containing protein [Noviherbaspirillum sedimenti]|uniref:FHA domain-containing protein n=1 Tax=Noviherbaspirillum sedimenti TaxID=2320865 RepID=A0A3A3G862_9BURK|nr:FHA domain-containing protein [Noviherbaspirillum sedimenti]RJG04161.1 FHA domain-containing protein [Noviherbaspirillum sedimenti]
MAQPTIVPDSAPRTGMPPLPACAILLQPVSHPELGEIRIDDSLFAIGRTEAPFVAYPPEIVADLSRRHARIFAESGTVYLADLDSKNGTTVNGVSAQQKITRLANGDEICFAGRLSYRVSLRQANAAPAHGAKLASLSLIPERNDLGLQPIVISRFPFLISKSDDSFARYRQDHPHQVNYLSRRHAHIFVKGGDPFIEDLGSTNGTFVNGKRLDEHAVPLHEGDVLAIGGHHFVYTLSLQQEATTLEPTVTRLDAAARASATGVAASVPLAGAAAMAPASTAGSAGGAGTAAAGSAADSDKTTFVAAAGSFLDIFCVDHGRPQEDEVNRDAQQAGGTAGQGAERLPGQQGGARGKLAVFAAELAQAFGGGERRLGLGEKWWRLPALAGALLTAAVLAYLANDPERELRGMLDDGEYARAATAAAGYLAQAPEQAQLRALGTEALLKAKVPQWQALLRARQFQRADAALAEMKQLARNNADVQPLLAELEWVGRLEQFVVARGGAEQPVLDGGVGADSAGIQRLLRQWDDDTLGHQQAFAIISSYVPEFRDQYAQALSHVRKLALLSGQQTKGGQDNGDQRQPPEVAH